MLKQTIFTSFFLTLFAVHCFAALEISELRIDQTGSDSDEYFELMATSSIADLSIYSYLVIGDGSASSGEGVIEVALSLPSVALNAGDFFVVAESSFTLMPSGTFHVASLNFENADQVTHLLVEGFTGANGDDLDSDDDGTLESTPWSSIVDGVALLPSGDTALYADDLGVDAMDGAASAGHIYRDGLGIWQLGNINLADATDTPGVANASAVPEPSAFWLLGLVCTLVSGKQLLGRYKRMGSLPK